MSDTSREAFNKEASTETLLILNDAQLSIEDGEAIEDILIEVWQAAQAEQPKQEPVGYLCKPLPIVGWGTLYELKQDEVSINPNGHFNIPLYTSPPNQDKLIAELVEALETCITYNEFEQSFDTIKVEKALAKAEGVV